jgi:hypothetical protein
MESDGASVRVVGQYWTFLPRTGDAIQLPSPAELKQRALDWIGAKTGVGIKEATELLSGCELEYEVVEDGNGVAASLGLVAHTDEDRADALSDEDDLACWHIASALYETCPVELMAFRTVVRE